MIVWVLVVAAVAGTAADSSGVASLTQQLSVVSLLNSSVQQLPASSLCHRHLARYFSAVSKEEWAQTMWDSSAHSAEGVLRGNTRYLGQFDECLSAVEPSQQLTAQHCMLRADLALSPQELYLRLDPIFEYDWPGAPLAVFYGVCVPSSCSPAQLSGLLNSALSPLNLTSQVYFNQTGTTCSFQHHVPYGLSEKLFLVTVTALVILAAASTIYEVRRDRTEKTHPLLTAFSLRRNGRELLSTAAGPDSIPSLDGLRTFSMLGIVIIHTFYIFVLGSAVNVLTMTKFQDKKPNTLSAGVNGLMHVEMFFLLGGLLVSIGFFRTIDKRGKFNFPRELLQRVLRLAPLHIFLVWVQSAEYLHLGDGPLWPQIASRAAADCHATWWRALLFFNNFLPANYCAPHTWFLSAYLQMYLVSPVFLYLLLWWPRLGRVILAAATIAATALAFALGYIYQLGPTLLQAVKVQFTTEYGPFYTRMVPWLVGLGLGHLLHQLKVERVKLTLSKSMVGTLWAVSVAVAFTIVFSCRVFEDGVYSRLEAASYLALHRLGWALAWAWVILACHQGHGGAFNRVLSHAAFRPLSKLSYAVYMVHIPLLFYGLSIQKTKSYLGGFETAYRYLGDVVFSCLLAVPAALLVEMPFINLGKHLLGTASIQPCHAAEEHSLPAIAVIKPAERDK